MNTNGLRAEGLLLVIMMFLAVCMPAKAWQFYNGSDISSISSGFVVLEPDNWSRNDLQQIRNKGSVPLAWLNLSQIEDSRLVPIDIMSKDYAINRRYLPEGKKLAIFYGQSFKNLVKIRLKEYLLKGFAGVVFAKIGSYSELSNSPINRSEMWRLIEEMSAEARRLNSSALVILHDSADFAAEIKQGQLISGVLEEGLYFGRNGRQIRAWDSEKRLKLLKELHANKRLILLAEDARTESRRQFSVNESQKHGFDPGFAVLPLNIERKPADD